MKSALLVTSGFVGLLLAVGVAACADSTSDIPEDGTDTSGTTTDSPNASLPAPTGGGNANASSTSSSGSPTSSSSTSSTSSTSSSGGTSGGSSGAGGAPACSFAGDFQKMIEKASEIQAQAPCDSSCNPTTHCCLDITGGGGGGIPGGGSSGIPGMDGGASSSGAPSGSGVCVSN